VTVVPCPSPHPGRHLTAAVLIAVVVLAAIAVPAGGVAAQQAACGVSPPANGTGYLPRRNPSSLPTGTPRPGPEILHEPITGSPQLENTGPWQAEPIMVSGTRAYRDGELLYQDFLYDDTALVYPDQPERYAGNAADIVEVRLRPLDGALGIRITFNSMLEVDAVATTIALGDSAAAQPLPHDAGAVAPGEVFVTVAGCSGSIVDAADGTTLDVVPVVTTDLQRRQVDVRVPHEAFDLRGRTELRVAAAAGLWDADAGRYLRPDPTLPAFFNVAFRQYGEWTQNTWMDVEQNEALAAADLSPFFATVDLTALADAVDDDLGDHPGGVPASGPMNRILVSRFEPVQGRGSDSAGGGIVGNFRCDPPECTPQLSGRLQPYSVYVPDVAEPAAGYGLVLNLHGANSNHNHFEGGGPQPPELWRFLAEDAGRPSIMLLPNARGMSYFYHGLAAADVFEAWAHVAALYDLDPDHVVQSGSSMGGFGTYKLGVQFPDLYSALFPNVGINAAAANLPPLGSLAGDGGDAWRMFASLRNVPVLASNGLDDPTVNYENTRFSAQALEALGYRFDFWWFEGAAQGGHAEYRHLVPEQYAALTAEPIDRDPRRVTYVLNDAMSEPEYGLTADHAYWLSGLALRDASALFGSIDVTSHGVGTGDPEPQPAVDDAGPSQAGSNPWLRRTLEWAPAPPADVADALDITAANVSAVTIDVDRARVSCDPTLDIDSDGPLEVTLVGRGCQPIEVSRHAGPTRLETAVAVSALDVDHADAVVIARADDYPDALAGGPLAASLGAPLLLTPSDRLAAPVAAEISRLGASRAILLGGERALAPQVAADLEDLGLSVRRVAGATRWGTAAAIAEEVGGDGEVLLARGDDVADALAASGLGASTGTPVLLTEPDRLPDETRRALSADIDVTVVGGTAAVSEAVAAEVDDVAGALTRLSGPTRYATSAAVADAALLRRVRADIVWVATGADFPDALVAGAAAGRDAGVLLLVDGVDLDGSAPTRDWLTAHAADVGQIRIAGGTAAVAAEVEQQLRSLR
jgi:putative cell wall-binding protein